VLRERGNQLRPSQVHADLDAAVLACRETHRLTPVAYVAEIDAEGRPITTNSPASAGWRRPPK
jgi:hypothetical protein